MQEGPIINVNSSAMENIFIYYSESGTQIMDFIVKSLAQDN